MVIKMERYYITKDGKIEASTATIESALDLIKQYQKLESHPFLKAEFSIIKGTETIIHY